MTKRIFAVLLCIATLLTSLVFVGCSGDDKDKGQCITAYLSDTIYDLDPARAYNNKSVSKIVGMLFDTLFKLEDNGKVKPSLVEEYVIREDKETGESIMELYLKEDAAWSDGSGSVSANDVVNTWERLLDPENDYDAAVLLFDIKNARAIKNGEGEYTISDLGLYPAEEHMVEIIFEKPVNGGKVDYDQFLLNLTSLALTPVKGNLDEMDWAKKGSTLACSGPFKLGRVNVTEGHPDDETVKYLDSDMYLQDATPDPDEDENAENTGVEINPNDYYVPEQRITDFIIERNNYYYRNPEKDKITKSVTPYRICVDCSLTDEQLTEMYKKGVLMYMNDIPLSLRKSGAIAKAAEVSDTSMSTATIYLNQTADVSYGTGSEKLYANANVRKALSMVIDRKALANAVVYAKAATGLLPTGMFEADNRKNTFRESCKQKYSTLTYDVEEAKSLINSAGLAADPAEYQIELTVAAYDEVHVYMAEEIVAAWQALGFTSATVKKVGAIVNNDTDKKIDEVPKDICDDIFGEDFRAGRYSAALIDLVAYSPDPFSMLAPFAKGYTGRGKDMSNVEMYDYTPSHITGYDSEEYNALIEKIFNQKNISKRAGLFRNAEKILMEDMPVIPIIFNLDATVTSKSLKKVSLDYNGIANFRKATIKKYDKYLDAGYKYMVSEFKPTDESLLAGWAEVDPTNAGSDLCNMPVKFTEPSLREKEVYSQHPMWNLRFLAARGCTYTSWNLLVDANNTVYSHFFAKEKARLDELEKKAEAKAD